MVMKKIRIKIRKRGKEGWKEEPFKGTLEEAEKFLWSVIAKHGGEKGSFSVSFKAGEPSMVADWTGQLFRLGDFFESFKRSAII